MIKHFFLVQCAIIACLSQCLTSCNQTKTPSANNTEASANKVVTGINADSLRKGEALFLQNCKNCHLLPDPKRLPKYIWTERILPLMAIRMGLQNPDLERVISPEEKKIEDENNLIPKSPMVSKNDYQLITDYINEVAPDTLPYEYQRITRTKDLVQFTRKNIPLDPNAPSFITGLKYDPSTKKVWVGNMFNQVWLWDFKKGIVRTENVKSAVVDFTAYKKNMYFTQIGSLMPSELSQGILTKSGVDAPILDKLHRPVCTVVDDINNDGSVDYIVGNFGKNLGSLSLFSKAPGSQKFKEQVLINLPGTVRCFVKDMNNDGRKDIIALLAQADEAVYILYQNANLKFEINKTLRFPPDYGTTDMVLVDYNKDGRIDIVTANGDNADYSNVLKKYHGLRVHINQGDGSFKEKFFFPVYGATKVLAEDFDQDGDIDFAVNCFYSDFGQLLHESFIYLENTNSKSFTFTAFSHKGDLPAKSLTLEKGDIDNDGDVDILMGNFAASPVKIPPHLDQQWKQAKYGLIVFENKLK